MCGVDAAINKDTGDFFNPEDGDGNVRKREGSILAGPVCPGKGGDEMAIIKMEQVVKKFGAFRALDGIDLTVNPGEIYGFIGPNGAGKTTAIRILLGILRATGGKAAIFGRDAWAEAVEIHKQVAYVPGEVNLWPNLTGGEVIDLFVRLRRVANKNRREELIERFALDPSKRCGTYSKGNRQKVALIAAFASDAELYILDEPTSGLDPLMEQVFQECIQEVREAGKSVLLSSHILSEVERLCDRLSIIRRGKIIETGTMEELRHLTRTNVVVQTAEPIQSLQEIAGVHDLKINGEEVCFSVDSERIGAVIKYISRFEILSLQSTPPTLEDLFIHHYRDEGG